VLELVIREHETYTTPLLPGFALPLSQLLSVSDALQQAVSDDDSETAMEEACSLTGLANCSS